MCANERRSISSSVYLLWSFFFFFLYSLPVRYIFIWCLAIYMSSRRRLPDVVKTSRPRYERLLSSATAGLVVAGCTDTRVRPITGSSSPPLPETQPAIFSPDLYPWPWSCPCQPSANRRNRRRRCFICPTRRPRRGEGTYLYTCFVDSQ